MDQNKRIIMLSGQQGSGKSTLANALVQAIRTASPYTYPALLKFAAPLYELHEYILNKMEGWTDKPRTTKDGPLLQWLGTEFGRERFGVDVWVNVLRNTIAKDPRATIIIDDCRFENEFDGFPDALRVRLLAPAEARKARMPVGTWRDNVNHPSETGLDAYSAADKFDLYLRTDLMSPEACAELVLSSLEYKYKKSLDTGATEPQNK